MKFSTIEKFLLRDGVGATVLIFLGVLQLMGMAVYLATHIRQIKDADDQWQGFQWDSETLLYSILMWVAWALSLVIIVRTRDDSNMKLGAGIFVCLPPLVFVSVFFELIQLGPK